MVNLLGKQDELNRPAHMVALLAAHFDDLVRNLKAINPAANIFGVSYISNIDVNQKCAFNLLSHEFEFFSFSAFFLSRSLFTLHAVMH